ncbi:MAG: SDR family NAD(P)-dependent oxidoreductase [Rhizobiales bacterium]|nr:SDR family NAD(P)-dependent oxidoreductase [Hyphomicrobiales bacterium]
MHITNKSIVITGGTSGIGYQMVRQLYNENSLIVISRSSEKLEALKNELPNIAIFQADLSNISELETLVDDIIKKHNSIDILVNNVAVQYTPYLTDDDFDYASISTEINLNFTSICSLCYLFLPALIKDSRSAIININSGLGLAPKTSSAVYCATKAGLNSFSKSLRYQLENTNIKVYQPFLDLVDTGMTEGRGKNKMTSKQAAADILSGVNLDKFDHFIGKVKWLKLLLRATPSIAARILKKN